MTTAMTESKTVTEIPRAMPIFAPLSMPVLAVTDMAGWAAFVIVFSVELDFDVIIEGVPPVEVAGRWGCGK
ncbi:hypothetical protein P154DRAFT_518071 [Amniculicola lignicola CBS 123094]|uniref:Uncharacterized protein n=1 Tax=Amniculicola lignicola CBS 123094 TaxID=1392246 RepID=A0A6A5X2L8_9PLEO|nr:hypothetical protein P154DRAFT_518071 [Amniculicola lignicola CBS 123094]